MAKSVGMMRWSSFLTSAISAGSDFATAPNWSSFSLKNSPFSSLMCSTCCFASRWSAMTFCFSVMSRRNMGFATEERLWSKEERGHWAQYRAHSGEEADDYLWAGCPWHYSSTKPGVMRGISHPRPLRIPGYRLIFCPLSSHSAPAKSFTVLGENALTEASYDRSTFDRASGPIVKSRCATNRLRRSQLPHSRNRWPSPDIHEPVSFADILHH